MSDISGYDIRYSTLDDLSDIKQWLKDPKACDDFFFDESEKECALKNWLGFSKFKASLTGVIKEVPCAVGTLFLMPYRKVAHHCSFSLIVDPKERNRGIGTSMVKNLKHLAKKRFCLESLYVELFEPNSLISILKREKFEEIIRQKNFLKMGKESRERVLWEYRF